MASISELGRALKEYFLSRKGNNTISGSIFVDAAATYDIGTALKPIRNIYATNITGTAISTDDFVIAHPTNNPTINKNGTWYACNFGLVGDSAGTVDESNHISLMLETVGSNGGGTIIIRALNPTDKIYIAKVITCAYSNVHIKFLSPLVYGAGASLRLMGSFDEFTRSGKNAGKLSTNAAAGGFTLVLSTSGSSMQASDFLVGDRIVLRGQNDINGKALEKQIVFITAINTGTNTLTVSEELDYTFKVTYTGSDWPPDATTGTTIYVTRYTQFTTNVNKNTMTATVVNETLFAIHDLVMVSDSRNEHDMNAAAIQGSTGNPPYVNPANLEFARITDIDYTNHTVTFDHALRRNYLTGAPYYGGITKVIPVENSSIEGAQITYNADQSSKSINSLQITYAENCEVHHCVVDGQVITSASGVMPVTMIGRMGHGCRISYAYRCSAHHNLLRNAGHTGSGEGYGFTIYYASSIKVHDNVATGCRHNYLLQLATQADVYNNESQDDRISGIDLHGVYSVDCHIHGNRISRSNLHTNDSNNAGGIRNGNTSHVGGDHGTVIENNIISGYVETSSFGIDFIAASSGLVIRNNTIIDCYNAIGNTLNSHQITPVQTISDVTIEGNQYIRCTNRGIVIGASPKYDNTNSNGMVDKLYIIDNISDNNKRHLNLAGTNPAVSGLGVTGLSNVLLMGNKVVNPDTSTANLYAADLLDIDNLQVFDNNLHGANKGIQLTRCLTACRISGNILTALVNTTAYNDGGGNTGVTFGINHTSSGVGIGTANPGKMLDVTDLSGNNTAVIRGKASGTNVNDQAVLTLENQDNSANSITALAFQHWNASSLLKPVANFEAALSTITNGAEVGFLRIPIVNAGTMYEYFRFAPNLMIIKSDSDINHAVRLENGGNGRRWSIYQLASTGTIPNHGLYFEHYDGSSFNAAMTIAPNGDVAILGNLNVTGSIVGAGTGHQTYYTKANASLTSGQTTAAVFTHNNTLPTTSDGFNFISASYTPHASGLKIKVSVYIPYVQISATGDVNLSLFNGSTCIAANTTRITTGGSSGGMVFIVGDFTTTGTSAITLSSNIGTTAGSTLTFNNKFNGLTQPFMMIEEFD